MKTPAIHSIKTKFFLVAAALVALSSLAWGAWVWEDEKRHLYANLEGDGKMLLSYLKAPVINSLVYDEAGIEHHGRLDNFVEEMVANPKSLTRYAYIVDADGRVLAHDHPQEYGKQYTDPLTIAALQQEDFLSRVKPDARGEATVLDMAMPLRIGGKNWGALRLGFSMGQIDEELYQFKVKLLTFAAGFFIVGTLVFYILGRTMSRPLEQLSSIMSGLDLEKLDVDVMSSRKDEIGILQKSFTEMVDRLKTSEQERRSAMQLLMQHEKMASVGKIVAGVAHEINNPLAALSACVHRYENKVSGDLVNCHETFKAGIQRISDVVHQLNDFSRAGSLELQRVPSETFTTEVEAFAKMALSGESVTFAAKDDCEPIIILMDKAKMHQVVLNLLLNAAYESPSSGLIKFHAYREGKSYCFTMSDQGKGIADRSLEKIFDIFYSTKPAGEGSGIGLAICKNIVEMHRGSIEVASSPGNTIFTVKIPLRENYES